MAYLKPGHFQRKYFAENYWQTRYQYWPCFEVKSIIYPEEVIEEIELLNKNYKVDLCLDICLLSKYNFVSKKIEKTYTIMGNNREDLLFIDEDLWLFEQ